MSKPEFRRNPNKAYHDSVRPILRRNIKNPAAFYANRLAELCDFRLRLETGGFAPDIYGGIWLEDLKQVLPAQITNTAAMMVELGVGVEAQTIIDRDRRSRIEMLKKYPFLLNPSAVDSDIQQ